MIKIEYLFLLIMLGFLTCYFIESAYLKNNRKGVKNFNRWEVIFANIFFGGPILLLFYLFEDYRMEDKLNHRSFLISGILFTFLQISLVFVLFHLKLIVFLP